MGDAQAGILTNKSTSTSKKHEEGAQGGYRTGKGGKRGAE